MKKQKPKLAKCPCCKTERHRTEMQTCISILEKLERQEFKHYKELELEKYMYPSFIDANFEWACDECLKNKKAILASPGAQETPWTPHLAYFDTPLKCSTCKKDFLFKKEEKKVWYESYKLPLRAQPNNCLECRRRDREENQENKVLSEILKKPENEISESELEKVVEIYASWDKLEKAKYYQAILYKRHRKNKRV